MDLPVLIQIFVVRYPWLGLGLVVPVVELVVLMGQVGPVDKGDKYELFFLPSQLFSRFFSLQKKSSSKQISFNEMLYVKFLM